MEPLSDPLKDRQIKSVKPPPHRPLLTQLMFPERLKSIYLEDTNNYVIR